MEQWSYTAECGKVRVPRSVEQAQALGWHKGTNYGFYSGDKYNYDDVYAWCRDRLNPYLFTTIMGTVWFYRERDATLCRLRWP